MIFPALVDAADDRVLREGRSTLAIYLHLVTKLDMQQWRDVKASALALRFGVHEDTVNAALGTLCERGYLSREHSEGRLCGYRLMFSRQSETHPKSGNLIG